MGSELARKQRFKLKKMERPIYVRNMNGFFNKKRSLEHIVKVNIYYQEHREKIEINIIRGQKWSVILEILQLAFHNSEIDQKSGEVKITRYSKKCRKQQKPKQEKLGQQKQKQEEKGQNKEKERKKMKN